MNHYYAMMVDLTSRICLVVGGGKVAERKVASLLEAGANVKVVSPTVSTQIQGWSQQTRLHWFSRMYSSNDGKGAFLVVAATNSKTTNYQIYLDAKKRDQWINVVDQPDLCNFTVPSIVKRGKLQIAISTGGASPSLAKKIRVDLEESFGEEYSYYLECMQEIRVFLKENVKNSRIRGQLLEQLTSDDWVEFCRKNPSTVKKTMHDWIHQTVVKELHHETIGNRNKKKRTGHYSNQLGNKPVRKDISRYKD